MSFTGYPKGLSFAFSRLAGFTKQIDIVYPDRKDDVSANSTIKVKFNPNSHIGLRTVNMYYKLTANRVGLTATDNYSQNRFAPRLSSSIIKDISLFFNSGLIERVEEYGLLYNTLFDLNCGQDQINKRFLEGSDPSIIVQETFNANASTITLRNTNLTTNAADFSDTSRQFVINNFMNFLGSSCCEYLSTNLTGDMELQITLNPASILWRSGVGANAVAAPTTPNYELDDIYFTYERIVLNDGGLYDEILMREMSSEKGLEIEFKTYSTHVGALQNRAINFSFNTSASSLNNIICTTRRSDYNTEGYLLLGAYNVTAATTNFAATLAAGGANAFNQCTFFQRDLSSITGSQIYINGTAMYKQPLKPYEIFNETLLSIYGQNDLTHSLHPGLNSLPAFLKYYFTQILSLNYNKDGSSTLISGLDGKGSTFNIQWVTTNDTGLIAAGQAQVQPIVFCEKSQVVVIQPGRQIYVKP